MNSSSELALIERDDLIRAAVLWGWGLGESCGEQIGIVSAY
jgi:hypothetical protein